MTRPQAPCPAVAHSRSDLRWLATVTLLTWWLAATFEWQEQLTRATARWEVWQLDELPLVLVVLGLGLAWFGWRRQRETAALLARNQALARQLIEVQERERKTLARELHDELAQDCTAIRIEASILRRAVEGDALRAAALRASDSALHLLDRLRGLLRRLRPAELDELGLLAALQSLATAHQLRTGVRCQLALDSACPALSAEIEMAVYRVAQEALSNVARHAEARCVQLALSCREGLALTVEDDGRGFDPAARTPGLGLLGAAERAALLGGRLETRRAASGGTVLSMTLPLGLPQGMTP